MSEAVRETLVHAPDATTWDVLLDVARMPELSPSTELVEPTARLTRVGQRFDQVVKAGPRRFRATWEVAELVPMRHLRLQGKVVGARFSMEQDVEPVDAASCRVRVTMRWRLPFGPLGRLASKLGLERRTLDEATTVLAGIARLAEAGADQRVAG